MEESHFAILRRHMVEVIEIYVGLAGLGGGSAAVVVRVVAGVRRVPRDALGAASLGRYA
jgi:protein-L-isoaspartate(D-aspartate) O-methyltransferase